MTILPVLLLGTYPRQGEIHVHKETLFHNREKLETTQISTSEQINSLWFIHRMEYHSTLKRNELLINVTTWMTQEHGEQKMINKKENMLYDFVYARFKKREKNNLSDNQPINQWIPKAVLGGRMSAKGHEGTVGDTGDVLYLDRGVCYLDLHTFVKTHLIICFKWVYFIICKLAAIVI